MEKIIYIFVAVSLLIFLGCTPNLPNIGFEFMNSQPNKEFINNCKTPFSELMAINLDNKTVVDVGYVKDIAILETAIRNSIGNTISTEAIDSVDKAFLKISCNRCEKALQFDKKNNLILVNLQKGNVAFLNKILLNLNVKYNNIDISTQQKIINWIISIDSIEFGGKVYSERHHNWDIITFQYQNTDHIHLLDSFYRANTQCHNDCYYLPSNDTDIKRKTERFMQIKNRNKLDKEKSIIIVYDTELFTLRKKFFFKYIFFSNKNGNLQIEKQLLNPEAFSYNCE